MEFFVSNGTSFLALALSNREALLVLAWDAAGAAFVPVAPAIDLSDALHCNYFEADGGAYLAVAFATRDPVILSVSANPFALQLVQNVTAAAGAVHSTDLTIDNTTILAFVGATATTFVWEGAQAVLNQTLAGITGADTCDAFDAAGATFLVVGAVQLSLFRWSPTAAQFAVDYLLTDIGAEVTALDHFEIGDEPFFAATVTAHDCVLLYHWNLNINGPSLWQNISVQQPAEAAFFPIGRQSFLAVVRMRHRRACLTRCRRGWARRRRTFCSGAGRPPPAHQHRTRTDRRPRPAPLPPSRSARRCSLRWCWARLWRCAAPSRESARGTRWWPSGNVLLMGCAVGQQAIRCWG